MQKFNSTKAVVQTLRPDHPIYCVYEPAIEAASSWFLKNFPGKTLFAVKTNPWFIDSVAAAGIDHFDVASLAEIELVHSKHPGARMSYMHPVKSSQNISRAYSEYGVRDFALDCEMELAKILKATNYAKDLNLFVRLSVSNKHSRLDLSGKFGIEGSAASKLLFKSRHASQCLGICFHAGSQLMNPNAFADAMRVVSRSIRRSGVIIDVLDVGGGFPSIYPGLEPPPLHKFVQKISENFESMPISDTCELWCEPGRALVAEAASLLVRVELRKKNTLYINDGTYGGLFDAGHLGFRFPVSLVGSPTSNNLEYEDFDFYGPTCDSMDYMPGPYQLPANINEGDYIEIGGMGAYSMQLRTEFNGFKHYGILGVNQGPMLSMYNIERQTSSDYRNESTATEQYENRPLTREDL